MQAQTYESSTSGIQERRGASLQPLRSLSDTLGPNLPTPAKSIAKRGLRSLATPLIRREARHFIDRIHAVFNTIDACPLTTIAAVNGVVFGGGFELALVCDLIVADKTARFCFPELRLGLIPGFGGIPRLERDLWKRGRSRPSAHRPQPQREAGPSSGVGFPGRRTR